MIEGRYDAIDVARYVALSSLYQGKGCTNLRLQKLLFFVAGFYLAEHNGEAAIFKDDFEAWAYGPVVPKVYREFRKYAASPIEDPDMEFKAGFDENGKIKFTYTPWDGEKEIEENDKKLIDDIVAGLKDKKDFELVDITHGMAPWKNHKKDNGIIPKDEICDYFLAQGAV